YTERWCRLKGNLLFYCKGNEKTSELAGLLVLERCSINKDLNSSRKYAFSLVFDRQDEGQHYHFAANSEAEYNDWIKRIKNASYEKLKEKLQKLCEQITEMTGEHPLPSNHPFRDDSGPPEKPENKPIPVVPEEPPLLEISLACNDLIKSTVENRFPNAVVIVSTMTPPGATWTRLAQTEIIEQKSDPYFLTTVSIPSGGNFSEVTRLKLAVFDVRDRDKEEMTHLGQAVCTIKDVKNSTNQKIQLSLTGLDSPTPSGTITLLGWKVESPPEKPLPDPGETFRPRCGSINKPKFDNVLQRSFRFPTILGTNVKVVDVMGESFLTFRIPQQLL
ncbi:type I inositol 3,4-bisphosphate 4-phosphatase-like, partial [Paramuricea clavata]